MPKRTIIPDSLKKQRVQGTVSPEAYKGLKAYSDKHNIPFSWALDQAIRNFLENIFPISR